MQFILEKTIDTLRNNKEIRFKAIEIYLYATLA
jgi:hypothetical protein